MLGGLPNLFARMLFGELIPTRPERRTLPTMKQKRIARKETRSLVSGGERIAKRLARAGVASRREAEGMIAAGRVTVNGRRLSSPAFNVRESDRIEVDGVPIPAVE